MEARWHHHLAQQDQETRCAFALNASVLAALAPRSWRVFGGTDKVYAKLHHGQIVTQLILKNTGENHLLLHWGAPTPQSMLEHVAPGLGPGHLSNQV